MKRTLALLVAALLAAGTFTAASAELLGLGVVTGITGQNAAQGEGGAKGNSQVNTTICALVLDDDGVIQDVRFDVLQAKVEFSGAGELVTDIAVSPQTKIEKGDAYGMKKASPIGREWFEQAAAFEAFCAGKTVEEVLGTPTYDKGDGHHTRVPDAPDLKTSVTMDIGDLLGALEKAAADAKARAAGASVKTFTLAELAAFDGKDGRPAYVAVEGKVYDVSAIPQWKTGAHAGGRYAAGADVTSFFKSFHGALGVLDKAVLVGVLGE